MPEGRPDPARRGDALPPHWAARPPRLAGGGRRAGPPARPRARPDLLAELVYSAICSLDLYVNDVHGKFEWAAPDEELHAFVNAQERAAGTYLYGRRMYETMAVWETLESDQPFMREYAEIWR